MLNLSEYHRPNTIAEAVELLGRKSPRTVALGGGTWLNGEGALRHLREVQAVVDVADLGLNRIETVMGSETGRPTLVRIGAAVTHQTLIEHETTGLAADTALSVIGTAATFMAGLNIRNRATLAGAICTADASSPLVTALLACDAELIVRGSGNEEKMLPLAGFLAYKDRILSDGILITEIRVTYPSLDTRVAIEKVGRTPNDYPILCAIAKFAIKDGIAGNVHVALGGVAATPVRLNSLELGLEKKVVATFLEDELSQAIATLTPPSDFLGTAEYRRETAQVLTRRVIQHVVGDSKVRSA